MVMAPLWETTAPFALFMFATVVTAWQVGKGPAILTGAVGLATRLYFDSPPGPGQLPYTWEEMVRLTLYAGFVVGTSVILDRMREDRRALEERMLDARREIDERRRVEAALEAARASAEGANRLKDEFLTLVSHELRTPLNAIIGWVALLRSGAVPPERSNYALEIIEKNANAQAKLVTDLLDIARSLTGQIELDAGAIDLNTTVRGVVESSRKSAAARHIAISITSDERPLTVWGDLERLQQITGHLLSNAIKFAPAGGQIGVTLGRNNGTAELVVTNTGEVFSRSSLHTSSSRSVREKLDRRAGTAGWVSGWRSCTSSCGSTAGRCPAPPLALTAARASRFGCRCAQPFNKAAYFWRRARAGEAPRVPAANRSGRSDRTDTTVAFPPRPPGP